MTKPISNPLEALKTSLQLEFEYFASHDWASDLLKAKKRQLELLHQLSNVTHEVKLAKRAEKPTGIPTWFKSTMPLIKDMIK